MNSTLNFYISIAIVGLFLIQGCASEPSNKKELPNTPETVATQWLNDYYNDRFTEAKVLSTKETQLMIDTVKSMLIPLDPGELEPKISIKGMNCLMKKNNSAYCNYFYHEEGFEPAKEEIFLLKEKGQWLVDETQGSDQIDQ